MSFAMASGCLRLPVETIQIHELGAQADRFVAGLLLGMNLLPGLFAFPEVDQLLNEHVAQFLLDLWGRIVLERGAGGFETLRLFEHRLE